MHGDLWSASHSEWIDRATGEVPVLLDYHGVPVSGRVLGEQAVGLGVQVLRVDQEQVHTRECLLVGENGRHARLRVGRLHGDLHSRHQVHPREPDNHRSSIQRELLRLDAPKELFHH